LNIQSTLGDLSVSRAAKVAKLAQLVSSGRYTADSAQTAKALVAGADSVEIR
jgi:anti-sigma28 factor (negative regulator of flagellin synthesis)